MITNKSDLSNQEIFSNNHSQEELNVKRIKPIFFRNKKLVLISTIFGLLFGGFNGFNQKRIWQGEFQIVLDSTNNSSLASIPQSASSEQLAKFLNQGSSNQALKTEIEILKSPSVLMDIFGFIKEKKLSKGDNSFEEKRFTSWYNKSLDIELEKGTKVLNIKYRDYHKDIILEVLNKISDKYQAYSDKKRIRGINLGLKFFEKQIEFYKNKSKESSAESQLFAIKNNLSSSFENIKKGSFPIINVERIRVEAIDELNLINKQIELIEELEENLDYEQLTYLSKNISNVNFSKLFNDLQIIEQKLRDARNIYLESELSVQNLIREKKIKSKLLRENLKEDLLSKKKIVESKMEASKRPEGVLVKYRQLESEASKDMLVLDNLQNNYKILLLEKARKEEPWELITKPTLLPYPVEPNKRLLILSGTILGFIGGFLLSSIIEIRRNNIFFPEEIENIMKVPCLAKLSIKDKKNFTDSLDLLFNGSLSKKDDSFGIIKTDGLNLEDIEFFKNEAFKIKEKDKIIITDNLKEAFLQNKILLIVKSGKTKFSELIEINRNFLTHGKIAIGFIYIESNL